MSMRDRTLLTALGFADPDKKDPLHDLGCQYIAQPSVVGALGLTRDGHALVSAGAGSFEFPISKGENQFKTTIGFLDVTLPLHYAYEGFEWRRTGTTAKFVSYAEAALAAKNQGYSSHAASQDGGVLERRRPVTQHDLDAALRGYEAAQKSVQEYKNRTRSALPLPPCGDFGGEYWKSIIDGGLISEEWSFPAQERVSLGQQWSSTYWWLVEVKIAQVGLGDVLRQINLYREHVGCSYASEHLRGAPWLLACAFEMSTAFVDGCKEHNITPVYLGAKFRKWADEQHALPKAVVQEA